MKGIGPPCHMGADNPFSIGILRVPFTHTHTPFTFSIFWLHSHIIVCVCVCVWPFVLIDALVPFCFGMFSQLWLDGTCPFKEITIILCKLYIMQSNLYIWV